MYLSVQQYEITSQHENGAAAVATLQLIHDMRASDLDNHVHYIVSLAYPFHKLAFRVYSFEGFDDDGVLLMRVQPPPGSRLPPHTLQTACREGFYLKGESEQSNINNYHWMIESDAALAVSRWRWESKSVLHDSWAWVHAVQFFIGLGLLSNLAILCLATYRNFMAGKPWIGDAFVSISTSQLVNGVAVLVSWYVNEWWSLREFCYSTVYHVAEYNNVRVHDMHMRADLLTLYLAMCGLIGVVFRERVDPLVAVVSFLIGYDLRIVLLTHGSGSLYDSLTTFVDAFYMENVSPRVPGQDNVSPLSFWTTHELGTVHYSVYARALLPIYATLAIPLGYVLVRKVYRHFVPDKVLVQRNTTGTAVSEKEQSLLTQKRVLTLFEVATGAALENRFGMAAEFNTCVFIKGTKYASADGIYSTGFVIANKKYLVQTSDYWSIVLMKILRRRFRNIYVYDVNGSTVQQTARLVYPHTLTVQDLLNINVTPLT